MCIGEKIPSMTFMTSEYFNEGQLDNSSHKRVKVISDICSILVFLTKSIHYFLEPTNDAARKAGTASSKDRRSARYCRDS